ncbi:hypothetical protein SAMN05443575_3831 [Jatrophihabitans endophyticus]|uniref:Uncharacterized protein n=1 Tax=Jatrophihabitans endophyticus TaxID=1206085 RepID=A0A1M5SV74_9ACTN|nr:hypothetical protein [Jatrophihabitans endophyticus]SHH42389.1 hypothetical protein SAMN05443575_3831 [Jatrophihabitans endophyticus]
MTVELATVLARTGEGAKAGPIGLAVILLLCIVCYFLFKSMSKHMRNVRENFPRDDAPAGTGDGTAAGGDDPAPERAQP